MLLFFDLAPISRSPRQSYEEEDSGVREAEVKLEQIQLDQESPGENMVIREEERLCQEEQEAQEREEEEQAEQEVGSGGADLLSRGLMGELMLGAALPCPGSLLLEAEPTQTLAVLSWHNLGWCHFCLCAVPSCGHCRQPCPFVRGVCLLPEFVAALPCPCHAEKKVLFLLWLCGQ